MSDRFDFQTVIEDPPTQCKWCGTQKSEEWKRIDRLIDSTDCYCSGNCALAGNAKFHLKLARISLFIGIVTIFISIVSALVFGIFTIFGEIILTSFLLIISVVSRRLYNMGIAIQKEIPEGSRKKKSDQ